MHTPRSRRIRDAISFAVGVALALSVIAVVALWFRSLAGPPDGTWRSDDGATVTILSRHATFTDLPLSPWSDCDDVAGTFTGEGRVDGEGPTWGVWIDWGDGPRQAGDPHFVALGNVFDPWSAIGTGGCDTEGATIRLTRVGD